MVTKTITMPDSIYDAIRDEVVQSNRSFSVVLQNYVKLGIAYETLLKLQDEERKAAKMKMSA